jgi:hypothetical protein
VKYRPTYDSGRRGEEDYYITDKGGRDGRSGFPYLMTSRLGNGTVGWKSVKVQGAGDGDEWWLPLRNRPR